MSMQAATAARDSLIRELALTGGPSDVVGIGISRDGGEYVVVVNVLHDGVDVPSEVGGVRVRRRVTGLPKAQEDQR